MIFSGSAVVDHRNTTGFGTRRNPPMVAIYTSAYPDDQEQSLAYSTDRGRTWTKYEGNPVLDDADREFRDPKVFWYEPDDEWRMVVVKASSARSRSTARRTSRPGSISATSDPRTRSAASGNARTCSRSESTATRVRPSGCMLVSLNPGAIAGGSGMQYFVGDFDGTTFRADNIVGEYTPPPGTLFEGFEGTDFGAWTTTGEAFGPGPTQGNAPGQGGVSGYVGNGLANSFHGFDASTGTLTSPTFEISRSYINFLVGGGAHPHVPGTTDDPPPPGTVFADFEVRPRMALAGRRPGRSPAPAPAAGTIGDQQPVTGYEGQPAGEHVPRP